MRHLIGKAALMLSVMAGAACLGFGAPILAADGDTQIFYNAKIYTADKDNPEAAAFAVEDGKFVYVGDDAGVKKLNDGKLGVGIDLQGKRVIPGMFESHAHPVAIASLWGMDVIEVLESDTVAQIQDKIRVPSVRAG